MTLPAKRKLVRSDIPRAPRREWPRHRKFVRSHECCVPNCPYSHGPDYGHAPIEFAHVRSAANAGMRLKPFDWFGVSMCHVHHSWQHQFGAETFEKQYGLDLWKLAAEFAAKSPDVAMRAAMRLAQGIEAPRAETPNGSVHESPVAIAMRPTP